MAVPLTLLQLPGRPVTIGAVVPPTSVAPAQPGDVVTFMVKDSTGTTVYATVATSGRPPLASATTPGSVLVSGRYTVTVAYRGDAFSMPSATTTSVR